MWVCGGGVLAMEVGGRDGGTYGSSLRIAS